MFKNITTTFLLLIIASPVIAMNNTGSAGTGTGTGGSIPGNTPVVANCTTSNAEYSVPTNEGLSFSCSYCRNADYNSLYNWEDPNILYNDPTSASSLCYTYDTSYRSEYIYSSGCTWYATCQDGYYMQGETKSNSSGCGTGSSPCWVTTSSCQPCSNFGAPYYNASDTKVVYKVTSYNSGEKTYKTEMSLDDYNFPSIIFGYNSELSHTDMDSRACTSYPRYISITGIYNYDYAITPSNSTEWNTPENHGCKYCTGDTIVNSTSDGCISCADVAANTNPDEDHGKCICQDNYYYVTASNKITTTENNNNACKEIPNIVYKWTNFDTGVNETTTDGKVPLTGDYTTLSSNDQTYQQITNTSIFPIHGWTYDTYDDNCNKSTPSTTLIAGNSISRTLLDSALKCIFKRTGNEDFAIQPAFTSKKIEYQRTTAGGTNITLCRAQTAQAQTCDPTSLSISPCTAAEVAKCTEFNNFTGYYAPEEKWNLTDDQGNKIKDANGNQISYAPGDTVKYVPQNSTTPVYLTLEVKQCEAGYYCTNGTRTKCPVGMTSDVGSDDITDCKTGTETKVCDDTGNCITLPSGLTLRQK